MMNACINPCVNADGEVGFAQGTLMMVDVWNAHLGCTSDTALATSPPTFCLGLTIYDDMSMSGNTGVIYADNLVQESVPDSSFSFTLSLSFSFAHL